MFSKNIDSPSPEYPIASDSLIQSNAIDNSYLYPRNEAIVQHNNITQNTSMDEISTRLDEEFVVNYCQKGGEFIYAKTVNSLLEKLQIFFEVNEITNCFVYEKDLVDFLTSSFPEKKIQFKNEISQAQIAITKCEYIVASDGNIILNTWQNNPRASDAFPQIQVIIVSKKQIMSDMELTITEFSKKHGDLYPFILNVAEDVKPIRYISNKLAINSRGTKNIYLFYCEDSFISDSDTIY